MAKGGSFLPFILIAAAVLGSVRVLRLVWQVPYLPNTRKLPSKEPISASAFSSLRPKETL